MGYALISPTGGDPFFVTPNGKGHLLGGKVIYSVSDPRFTTLPTAGSSG